MADCGWSRRRTAELVVMEAFLQAFAESGLPPHPGGECPSPDCPCESMLDGIEARAEELAAAKLGIPVADLREDKPPAATAEPFRLLVTGSRSWQDAGRVWGSLQALADQMPGRPLVIVHGDAKRGVDQIARRWVVRKQAYGHPEITEERHPVTDEEWARFGRRAGMLRNEAMVEAGADACWAWIAPCSQRGCTRTEPHGSHGATDCAQRAEDTGIPTSRWYTEEMLAALDGRMEP